MIFNINSTRGHTGSLLVGTMVGFTIEHCQKFTFQLLFCVMHNCKNSGSGNK